MIVIGTESDAESFPPCYFAKHNRLVANEADISSLFPIKKTTKAHVMHGVRRIYYML